MWDKYVLEREGLETLKYDFGFCLIKRLEDTIYLKDIWVVPEQRQGGRGRAMLGDVEVIARKSGKSKILGSCSPEANGSTNSLKAMLACGFQLHSCQQDIIYLIKELK